MNELKERLRALGLTEEQIDGTIQTVADHVRTKLPAEYGSLVDSILAGEKPDLSALAGKLLGGMKGLFD